MHISSLRIQHYKSFFDSGPVSLSEGFNVVVGQNNAGKTALLEAASLRYNSTPHRSLRTLPRRASPLDVMSEVEIDFTLSAEELIALTEEIPAPQFVPWDTPPTAAEAVRVYCQETNTIGGKWNPNVQWTARRWNGLTDTSQPSMNLAARNLSFRHATPHVIIADEMRHIVTGASMLPTKVLQVLYNRIYAFRAERLFIGESAIYAETNLQSNAGNLAQVLNYLLSSNPERWKQYLGYVASVFPQITQLTVPPSTNGNQTVSVFVWSIDPKTERDDLAVPLSASGTGIAQVLAILYVIITAEVPKIIIIDEPQSFLHPGAVRKLFDILHRHPQHQYIISTHSAGAVAAARANRLLMVRNTGGESSVTELDATEGDHLQSFLADVGARLSDVFGADQVLWVEGRTEEVCFPIIMASLEDLPIAATSVIGVVSTGDFEARARPTFAIYRKLTEGPALMPPSVGFIFDREQRSETEIADLLRESRGRARFTARRLFENYLLHASAIAAAFNDAKSELTGAISPERVSAWIDEHRWDRELFARAVPESKRTQERWLNEVHGAKLLARLFRELSAETLAYDKVAHGAAITAWLCASDIDSFIDIRAIISDLLKPDDSTPTA